MPATKTKRTILTSQSLAAGANVNGTESNQTTAYGAFLIGRITNGATGPTVGCDMVVTYGGATGEKFGEDRQTALVTAGLVNDLKVDIHPAAMFVNVQFVGHTGQPVTVECFLMELSTI